METRRRSDLYIGEQPPFLHIQGIMTNIAEFGGLETAYNLACCNKDLGKMTYHMICAVLVSQCFGNRGYMGSNAMSIPKQNQYLREIAERGMNDALISAVRRSSRVEMG